MDIITLDFETFYDKDYSLSKMTTEEYIRDPRFEAICVGVKFNAEPTQWCWEEDLGPFLRQYDWENCAALAHNAAFDGAILNWKYGIRPKLWFDTLSMGRPRYSQTVGVSLKALATELKIGEKGTEVHDAKGKRAKDFSPAEKMQYLRYCIGDVDLTYSIFYELLPTFNKVELSVIDQTIRMFTEPTFVLDKNLLAGHLSDVQAKKAELMSRVDADRDIIMSNDKLAAELISMGVQPPKKISPKTGKLAWAFAKSDKAFQELLEHPNEDVQNIVAARLGVKSTIEETRTQRFMGIADRGPLPIMLNYYAAHTGRFSGGDKQNLQNLPRGGAIRDALKAPDGHVVIVCDSSQIEARVLAWLAGQDDLLDAFRNKRDVYSEFATNVYNRSITKANTEERFVGKTCVLGLGYQMGPPKFRTTLASGTSGPIVIVDEYEAKRIVDLYRKKNNKIKELWWNTDHALECMAAGHVIGTVKGARDLMFTRDGFITPCGGFIRYNNLRKTSDGLVYDSRRQANHIFGGKAVENVVQHLAQAVIKEQMVRIKKRYRVVLQVHDEIVIIVREEEAEEARRFLEEVMSTPPAWALDLPVACESGVGRSYGEAK